MGCLFLLTTDGRLFYLCPSKSVNSSFKKPKIAGLTGPISKMAIDGDKIYCQLSDVSPIPYSALITRFHPSGSFVFGDTLVDTKQLMSMGFQGGDRIEFNGEEFINIGVQKGQWLLYSLRDEGFVLKPMLSLEEALLRVKLISEDVIDVDIEDFGRIQILKISNSSNSFKTSDIVSYNGEQGKVIGFRAGLMFIDYDGHIRACSEGDISTHELISREGHSVEKAVQINGSVTYLELDKDSGTVVVSNAHGVGIQRGTASGMTFISFLANWPYVRNSSGLTLSVLRTPYSHKENFKSIGNALISVDIGSESLKDFGLLPADIIRVGGTVYQVVGAALYKNVLCPVVESEEMIVNRMNMGFLGVEPFKYDLIARIGAPGTRTVQGPNDETLTLSVNTEDYTEQPLLPGDVISVGGMRAEVAGVDGSSLYYEIDGVVQKLTGDYMFNYRRVNVPTDFVSQNETASVVLKAFVGIGHMPQSLIQEGDETYRILGVLNDNSLLCLDSESKPVHVSITD